MLLQAFEQYLEDNRESLVRRGVDIPTVHHPPPRNPKPGMYADFDTETRMGRITLWCTGECDIEALDVDSGCQLFWEHYDVSDSSALVAVIQSFIEKLTDDR